MKRLVALALLVALVIPSAASATGNSNSTLKDCVEDGTPFWGGVEFFALKKGKGASRVVCPDMASYTYYGDIYDINNGANVFDLNLNGKYRWISPELTGENNAFQDIWNNFGKAPRHKGIESFRAVAYPGCTVTVEVANGDIETQSKRYVFNNRNGEDVRTWQRTLPYEHKTLHWRTYRHKGYFWSGAVRYYGYHWHTKEWYANSRLRNKVSELRVSIQCTNEAIGK